MIRGGVALFCIRIVARLASTIKFVNEMVVGQRGWWSFRQQMERYTLVVASEATIGNLVFGAIAKTRVVRHLCDDENNAEYSSQPVTAKDIRTGDSQDAKQCYSHLEQSGSNTCRPLQPSPSSEARLEPKWLEPKWLRAT